MIKKLPLYIVVGEVIFSPIDEKILKKLLFFSLTHLHTTKHFVCFYQYIFIGFCPSPQRCHHTLWHKRNGQSQSFLNSLVIHYFSTIIFYLIYINLLLGKYGQVKTVIYIKKYKNRNHRKNLPRPAQA